MSRRGCIVFGIAFAVAAACGSPAPRSVEMPTPEAGAAEPSSSPDVWVEAYGGAVLPVERNDRERELWSRSRSSGGACLWDDRLALAARDHARELASSKGASYDSEIDRVRWSVQRHGGTDYGLRPVRARFDSSDIDRMLQVVARSDAGWSHCAVGVEQVDEEVFAVWIGTRRTLELDPLPVRARSGQALIVRGRVLGRRSAVIQPYWAEEDGPVARGEPVTAVGGRFAVRVVVGSAGRYELELAVDGGRGAETAVLVPLFVGVSPDPRPIVGPNVRWDGAEDPVRFVLELVNNARARRSIAPLLRDGRLDRVAREHSREMARTGFFGHVSPYRGALERRLALERLEPVRFAENVAKSDNLYRAHRNLVLSPSHRINLLDEGFTHVGIGVEKDAHSYLVTQIFAAWR